MGKKKKKEKKDKKLKSKCCGKRLKNKKKLCSRCPE